jgi:N-acetylmuramoyl-L-alanine amidase
MARFWIIGRKHWAAIAPRDRTFDQWSSGVTLVVHHTAGSAPQTRAGEAIEMRSIQRAHFAHGWSDIGYNYVIMPSGRVWEGRGYGIRGAHTANNNTNTIGVSFAGNYDVNRPTRASLRAYRRLVRHLRRAGADIKRVRGHQQMPQQATACPGRYLMRALRL